MLYWRVRLPPIFEIPMRSGAVLHICICHANQEVPGLRRSERKARRSRLESNCAQSYRVALSRLRPLPLRVLTQFEPSRFLQYSSSDTRPRSVDLVVSFTLCSIRSQNFFARYLGQTFRSSSEATDRVIWTWGPSSHPTRLSAACSASCS